MLAALGVCGVAVGVVASRAQADAIDVPTYVDVTSAGDVLVGFQTDVVDYGIVRRLSPAGAVLAAWSVSGAVGGVAWDRASGVMVNLSEADRVEAFDTSGAPAGGWTLEGLLPDLAVGVTGRSLLPSTYVLADGEERTEVVRVSAGGGRMTSWPVVGTPYELAWSPTGGAEGTVQVAVVDHSTPAGAIIVSYGADGTELAEWSVNGEIRGLDFDAHGRSHVGILPERSLYGWLGWYEDGDLVGRCALPGYPVDVAADPAAGSWVIVLIREGADGVPRSAAAPVGPVQLGNEHALLHVLEDCTIAATWSNAQLVGGVVTPTPSRTEPSPSATPSNAPGTTPTASTTNAPPAGSVFLPALVVQRR
jgi:hypothetical protein